MSQLELTDAQWASFAAEFCKGFTKEQADVCRTFCQVRGLLPGKHVIFGLRTSSEWDEAVHAKVKTQKIFFMTTIDAARLIAQRTGQYGGQAPEQYVYLDADGSPSIVSEIPLPQLPLKPGQQALPREPWAVKTTVYRKDFDHPVSSIARFDAYAVTYTKDGEIRLTDMWIRRGPEMLAKCSEMLSLRKSFPEELSNLYLDTELKSDQEETPKQPVAPSAVIPNLPTVPPVNQEPAVGTDAARPGEKRLGPNPEQDKQLETEREKAVEQIIAAVPSLKPASELPAPKKRGRKPKEIPNNGQNGVGIDDQDLDQIGTPAPVIDRETHEKAATDFVDSVTNFTPEQAAEAGLPEPPEYSRIPEKGSEEMKLFVSRVRALTAAGALGADVKNYILAAGKKSETDKLTARDWDSALIQLENAQREGKLKEVTKNAPLPEKF